MKYLLNIIYLILLILISPIIIYRMIAHNRYRKGWGNRMGKVDRNHPDKKCIWLHGVSVGEINASRTVIENLKRVLPDYEIVISTTTDTGFARANAIYGDKHKVFYFPMDFSFAIKGAFKRLKPSVCIMMELEIWPNFASCCKKTNTPLMIINGRISSKSFNSYYKVRWIIKSVFNKIDLVLCQTSDYADKFIALGCDSKKVKVVNSLKYDTAQITDKIEGEDLISQKLNLEGQKLFIAGGTGPGEEKTILEVYKNIKDQQYSQNLRLAIVPRKPERFDEVANLIEQFGFKAVRYSQFKEKLTSDYVDKTTVILGDTMGDLRKFYSLAYICFVGRSLVPMGGSDMIESAALGRCTLFGPHAFNFKQSVDVLLEGNGAILVSDQKQLQEAIEKCLKDPAITNSIAQAGQKVVRDNQGATGKTVDAIINLLKA